VFGDRLSYQITALDSYRFGRYAFKDVQLTFSDTSFRSSNKDSNIPHTRNKWMCCDFKRQMVIIRSIDNYHRLWEVEASNDERAGRRLTAGRIPRLNVHGFFAHLQLRPPPPADSSGSWILEGITTVMAASQLKHGRSSVSCFSNFASESFMATGFGLKKIESIMFEIYQEL
jgi:hypothetical protein